MLAAVGDGVFLVDAAGSCGSGTRRPRRSPASPAEEVVGRPAAEAFPGWDAIAPRVPVVADAGARGARAETVPLELGGRELWLSISGVGFADGTVYAFRDLTQDRVLEELKAEFVSTVSHELRTPLAAIYGAAHDAPARRTSRLDEEQRDKLLDVIAERVGAAGARSSTTSSGRAGSTRTRCRSRSRAATPTRSREA